MKTGMMFRNIVVVPFVAGSMLLVPVLVRANAESLEPTQLPVSAPTAVVAGASTSDNKAVVSPYAKANRQRAQMSKRERVPLMAITAGRLPVVTGQGQRH